MGKELRWGWRWGVREGLMRGRRAGDGTFLSLWRRRCHLRCRCRNLRGCCSNSEKDLETGGDEEGDEEDDDEEAAERRR